MLAGRGGGGPDLILAISVLQKCVLDRAPTQVREPPPAAAGVTRPIRRRPRRPRRAPPGCAPDRRAIDERLSAIRASARRQIAAAQRPQLLNTLSAGLILDPGDGSSTG